MLSPICNRLRPWAVLFGIGLACLAVSPPLWAQGTGGPGVSDSRDGYIDSALPGNQFRLRYDDSFDLNRPSRAEWFWPRSGALGPGPPLPESRVDFQDLTAYLECAGNQSLSGFVEVPWRFLNPEINADHNGISDINAGFKYAFYRTDALVATLQGRIYFPTGDGHEGLGNDHVTLEPGLLLWLKLPQQFGLEGELRYWTPVGGTDFAGNIVRYGLGLHYDLPCWGGVQVSPVATVVGWTVLNGKVSVLQPSGRVTVNDAAEETIVNVKLGVRTQLQHFGDVFVGYGRALTGDRWYSDTVRLEWRLSF
jgi:hypothetical protein